MCTLEKNLFCLYKQRGRLSKEWDYIKKRDSSECARFYESRTLKRGKTNSTFFFEKKRCAVQRKGHHRLVFCVSRTLQRGKKNSTIFSQKNVVRCKEKGVTDLSFAYRARCTYKSVSLQQSPVSLYLRQRDLHLRKRALEYGGCAVPSFAYRARCTYKSEMPDLLLYWVHATQ